MSTPKPPAQYATRTSGTLALGVFLLVAGGAAVHFSMQERLVAAVVGDEASPLLGLFGGTAALVGLIALVIGIHDLAANVDIIAERAGYEIAVSHGASAPHSDQARSSPAVTTVSASRTSTDHRDEPS